MTPMRKSKKKPLPWKGYHLTRQFIFDEITEGCVTPDMGSREIHNNYKDIVRSFELYRMEYSSTFASRLDGLRKIVARDRSQASDDTQSLTNAIWNYSPHTHNSRGEPQLNWSEAQRLLDDEIEAGKHLRMSPKELHETRDEYKWFKLTTFNCHIEQSIRTAKYNHTLKVKVDA